MIHDLNHPDYNPPDCPAWAKEDLPEWALPFRGLNGLDTERRNRDSALAMNVRGIDRYHANQFVVYRPETAEYLYGDYTPLDVNYRSGLLPTCEAVSAEVTTGCHTRTEKALALLRGGVTRVRHPAMPPCGPRVRADRSLSDEALLKSGSGLCNEQARVFIRLCQVNGIPARIVHTFYSNKTGGHCIAEFHTEGAWHMADASWFCVFPGPDGRLLSAAECHDRGEGQAHCGVAYRRRMEELLAITDGQLGLGDTLNPVTWRARMSSRTAEDWTALMDVLAVINYPLPTASATTAGGGVMRNSLGSET